VNVNFISYAQLCADLKCWIVLNGTGGYAYDKGGNKLCSFQNLGNLFFLELGLQSNPDALSLFFRRVSKETLRKLGFHGELDDCHICTQGKLEHSKFSRSTSYCQQLLQRVLSDFQGPFIEGFFGERY
jgi:hypothetical protein